MLLDIKTPFHERHFEKSDGESEVEWEYKRKQRNSALGDGDKDVLTLFIAMDVDDTVKV